MSKIQKSLPKPMQIFAQNVNFVEKNIKVEAEDGATKKNVA